MRSPVMRWAAATMLEAPPIRWVVDASVAINLLSMPDPGRLLGLLGAPCVIPDVAAREVRRLNYPARRGSDPLVEVARLLSIVDLSDDELNTFGDLVGADRPDDLDDGEAAVLAVAVHRGGACMLDERKCIRIASGRVPPVTTKTTMDLLRWAAGTGVDTAQSILDALRFARMRIPAEHAAWVVDVIGTERAAEFPSLSRWTLDPRLTRGF